MMKQNSCLKLTSRRCVRFRMDSEQAYNDGDPSETNQDMMEVSDHPSSLWQDQDVVNIEVKPQIKLEETSMYGSWGMLDMLATVATDQLNSDPSLRRIKTETDPAESGLHRKRKNRRDSDRLSYLQISKMSLNNLTKMFSEVNCVGGVYTFLCRLMAPDDTYANRFVSYHPCHYQVCHSNESRAKNEMKAHLQTHVKDILNAEDFGFSAEPIPARLRRLSRVKDEFPVKTEWQDDVVIKREKMDEVPVTFHDHTYAATDVPATAAYDDSAAVSDLEEATDDREDLIRAALDGDHADQDDDEDAHAGFLTQDPVIRLASGVRCSVNEVETAKDPWHHVPLIGSEVDVADPRTRIRRDSLNSPNSSDSGNEELEAEKAIEALRAGGVAGSSNVCTVCRPERRFTAYTSLLNHLKSHAGIKEHACHVCGAVFRRQNTLQYHLSVHRNETKFTCAGCGRKFRHPSHYREHVKRHNGDSFRCDACDVHCKSRKNLEKHHKMHHEETSPDAEVARISASNTSKENASPPPPLLPEFDGSPPRAADAQTVVAKKKSPRVETASNVCKKTVQFLHSDGAFVPFGGGGSEIFKDVSNTPGEPKAILATLNGKQVLLIPKTEEKPASKLEQCLRFGSASVASNATYVNQFNPEANDFSEVKTSSIFS